MNWVRLYSWLPYSLRVVAASLKGYYLKGWRYSRQTEVLVQQALEREQWSREQWQQWQQERLSHMLHRAVNHVPYYREMWSQRRQKGDRSSWEYLENWPLLKKDEVRTQPKAFVADDCNPKRMYNNHTSGTTGTPIDTFITRKNLREWFALLEARMRKWYDVSRRERWVIIGGQIVTSVHAKEPPFWVYNAGLKQLYISAQHISPQNTPPILEALREFSPTHMIVYPASASVIAYEGLKEGLEFPELEVVFSNADILQENHREVISKAFSCPVVNTYGMSEYVAAASECGYQNMHVWPEVGWIEVLQDNADVYAPDGEVGRLVSTSLLNQNMPLVRYETGDRAGWCENEAVCRCGRSMPILERIEGRQQDFVVTRSGRKIFWLNPIFYGMPIREAQIVQESLDLIRVRLVPAPDYTSEDGQNMIERLCDRVGKIKVELDLMESIPRAENGKFRSVVSHLRGSD